MKFSKYSPVYFKKTKHILKKYLKQNISVAQFYELKYDNPMILSGIEESLKIIKHYLKSNFSKVKIYALKDGSKFVKGEPVLQIIGKYYQVIEIENIICGLLSRGSSIATNCSELLKITNTPIIFMGDRQDHYLTQPFDGYSSYYGGIRLFVTNAHCEYLNIKPIGTIPHSLIQSFNGNLIETLTIYNKEFPHDHLCALVDYNNDVINDSLKVAKHFKYKLWGVRVDTASNLIDKSLIQHKNDRDYYGGSPYLINQLREELDKENFSFLKIVVSSGINKEKILNFKKHNCKIDYYGIGGSLLKVNLNFTCDLVMLNNQKQAKVGRSFVRNDRLKRVL